MSSLSTSQYIIRNLTSELLHQMKEGIRNKNNNDHVFFFVVVVMFCFVLSLQKTGNSFFCLLSLTDRFLLKKNVPRKMIGIVIENCKRLNGYLIKNV